MNMLLWRHSDIDKHSDATVSVSNAIVPGEEGTNVIVCASVVDASPGTIDADIELSFELVPDTAGRYMICIQ